MVALTLARWFGPGRTLGLKKSLLQISGTLAVLHSVLMGSAVNPVTG